MDSIKAAIEKKRKAADDAAATTKNAGGKKYVRRGDVARGAAAADAKDDVNDGVVENRHDDVGADVVASTVVESDVGEPPLSIAAVVRQLRSMGEPATFFAETSWQRYRRFRKAESKRAHHVDKLVGVQEDDFGAAMRALAEQEKEAKLDEARQRRARDADEADGSASSVDDAERKQKQSQLQQQQSAATTSSAGGAAEQIITDYRTEGDLSDAEKDRTISAILKRFMREWDATLSARPDTESRTPQGRIATATFAQCNAQIEPLFRVLASGGLHEEIRKHLFTICVHMERKEYIKAHDAYILLAIGKAAWPMGVTMVGIHERAGRSKIYDNKTAHILNDETQRKYIQSVKRLLSFAQSKYPTKPSQMVIF